MKGPVCILFNILFMNLNDRMKKNEFGYEFAILLVFPAKYGYWQMTGKSYYFTILIIKMQVLNAMILWHKTQNKKKTRYVGRRWKTKKQMVK